MSEVTVHACSLLKQSLLFVFITRAALLTGRYQTRSGVYPGVFSPPDVGGVSGEGGWLDKRTWDNYVWGLFKNATLYFPTIRSLLPDQVSNFSKQVT